ncbi:MAG: hypothetical protein JO209_08540 [Acidisphaera sp.]|nr:hypothetical protein [Acidisphaera sp.]
MARLLHVLATVALGLVVLAAIGVGALAWRLSRGPLDLAWLARRVEASVNQGGPTQLHIGAAALAWEGWRLGLDRPLDLRLSDIEAREPGGERLARIPRAEVSVSFGALLLGRLEPRAVEIDGARLRVLRAGDGTVSVDLGSLADAAEPAPNAAPAPNPFSGVLAELARPPRNDRTGTSEDSRWSQLRRLRIAGAELLVVDRQLAATWRAPHADLDLRRRPRGGVEGTAELTLALGDQSTEVTASASLQPGDAGTRVSARFTPFGPAALARAAPSLAPLAALDAPVGGTLDLDLGPHLAVRHAALHAEIGPGSVQIAGSAVGLGAAALTLEGDRDAVTLSALRVALDPSGRGPVLQGTAQARRAGEGYVVAAGLDLDQLAFADLARYWPETVGRNARDWLTANITAGTAHDGHADLALAVDAAGSVTLTGLSGKLLGDDVTAFWLRPVPPIEHAAAQLTLLSPDALLITAQNGRQAGTGRAAGPGIVLRSGSMRITGLSQKDQTGQIDLDVAGSLPDALAVLRQPRLRLLARHPMELRDPAGQVAGHLALTVPLEKNVTIDEIPIRAQGRMSGVHLTGIAAGHDLAQGTLDFDVGNDGLTLGGTAELAGIEAQLGVEVDFRAGPPGQVLQHYTLSATPDARQLAAAGLDAGGLLAGDAAVQADVVERRDGSGEATIHADLQRSALSLGQLGWDKAAGTEASADARLLLSHDHLVGVDRLELQGAGIDVHGAAEYADGKPTALHLDRIVLGATQAQGELRFAAGPSPLRASLSGPSLDISGRFGAHRQPAAKPASADARPAEDRPGPPWVADLRFGRVILGPGRALADVSAHAEDDGRVIRQARIDGRAGAADRFQLAITPAADGRHLSGSASDAGALLRDFDLVASMQGGTLALAGRYDDGLPGHPLQGTAEIDRFRLRDAPVATRLLQAMTLYGLVDVLRGPGLNIDRLIAPFRLDRGTLDLADARAFSSSLGFTAKGRIDTVANTADLEGTIVPAYFFNTLLGNVPLLGRLFSPEQGGGVFAATYTVRGRLDDPAVSVNPLAALTPGFLRGLFGVFGKGAASRVGP